MTIVGSFQEKRRLKKGEQALDPKVSESNFICKTLNP